MLLACISLSVTHHNCYLINTDFFIPPSMRDAKTKNQSSNIKATVEREREKFECVCCELLWGHFKRNEVNGRRDAVYMNIDDSSAMPQWLQHTVRTSHVYFSLLVFARV